MSQAKEVAGAPTMARRVCRRGLVALLVNTTRAELLQVLGAMVVGLVLYGAYAGWGYRRK